MNSLGRLLKPRSIAVYGGHFAEAVIRQCDRMGFDGQIWPVHPERKEIAGRSCFRDTQDLPKGPDAAFVGINREATIPVIKALAEKESGGAVCYASGFKEAGEQGRRLQDLLLEASGQMPLLGPNCYGLINYLDGALLWPDVHGGIRLEKGVALITQSSNVGVNLTMSRRGVPLAYLLTVGNQAKVGLHHMIRSLVEDRRITAIGMYIEGISDAAAFAASIEYANRREVPVAVVKVGKTPASQQIAMSHTASLTGSDEVMSAFFRRLGVARVHSVPALLETMKVLHYAGPLKGNSVASLSCSGGEASLVSDSAKGKELEFRRFSEVDKDRIRKTVNPLVSISNPFDYHTFDWGDHARLRETFTAVMASGFDMTALVLDFPRVETGAVPDWDAAWQALAAASETTRSKACVISSLPESLPEHACEALGRKGLVPLHGIDDALAAIEAAMFVGTRVPSTVMSQIPELRRHSYTLDEGSSKDALSAFGVAVADRAECADLDDAIEFWQQVGSSIVLKAIGASVVHKTDVGGIALNLDSEVAIAEAYERLLGVGDSIIAETMIKGVVGEIIVGAVQDPVIGLHMVVGTGGVYTELFKDSRVLLLPFTEIEVQQAIQSLNMSEIFFGWRGLPAADVPAAVQMVMCVQDFVYANSNRLAELDINPIALLEAGRGALALDAMIRFYEEPIESEVLTHST